jgi:hypothetical protein
VTARVYAEEYKEGRELSVYQASNSIIIICLLIEHLIFYEALSCEDPIQRNEWREVINK